MNRILVTGGTGFIGRALLATLAGGADEVHAITSKDKPPTFGHVTWHRHDLLTDASARALIDNVGPSHLVHLAWSVPPGEWHTSAENARWLESSVRLVSAFAQAGGRRMVLAGSCAEYDLRHGYCSEERTPIAPSTLYGKCKVALHRVADALASSHGMSLAWGRIFFVYGPNEDGRRLVAGTIRALLEGERPRCSAGAQIRDYMHVDDVAAALVTLIHGDVEGAVNVASGQPVSVRQLVETIEAQLSKAGATQFGALPTAAHDPPFIVGDPSRLKDLMGWSPAFSLQAGLASTIEWWRTRVAL